MPDTDTSHWQTLMDDAYEHWRKHKWSYKRFINTIGSPRREAVLLGNLNCQVQNGGFRQWVDNGYAAHGMDVCDILDDMGTDIAAELAMKIKELLKFVDIKQEKQGYFYNYWLEEEDDDYSPGSDFADT